MQMYCFPITRFVVVLVLFPIITFMPAPPCMFYSSTRLQSKHINKEKCSYRVRRRGIGCETCCLDDEILVDCTGDVEPHHCCATSATTNERHPDYIKQTSAFFTQRRSVAKNVKCFQPRLFVWHIVRAAYCWPFDKVWLSSVCWSPSAKHGNEVECGIYIGSVKMQVEFEAFCGAKFMTFWDDVGDPL